ncbi:hypothetical protein CHELA1G11_12063 [Hyphomicrobiales bacterium]|nr:hypothetical protein CHELA1G11_12063 [Hyphomicrobiales bacterium]
MVLASPITGGGQFRIVENVKGEARLGAMVEASADRAN